jgi:uroporphyrin-III C-methyltransferase
MALAAKSTATVVILMGMSKLEEIVSIFQSELKEKHPLRLFKTGPTRGESGIGTIDTIREVVAENKLSSPAIM